MSQINHANPGAVADASNAIATAAKLKQLRDSADFQWLMSDERGRRYVWRLLEQCGVYRSSFTGNSETFYREGMRNIGLILVKDCHQHCPDQYQKMVLENSDG